MQPPILRTLARIAARLLPAARLARRLRGDRRGNVLMIVGLSILPLVIATGMGIDYAKAARLQTKLNAVADAAALSAVTLPMMSKTRYDAALAAGNMFYYQAQNTAGAIFPPLGSISYVDNGTTLTGTNGVVTVVVTDSYSPGLSRTAKVSYTAQSVNAFGGILGMAAIPIGGSSTTLAKTAPDIDFYVLMDASQSMLLPATSAGLTAMKAATLPQVVNSGRQVGCAFACHQSWRGTASLPGTSTYDPTGSLNDIRTNPLDTSDSTHKTVLDNYQVARSLGITLRSDLLVSAVQQLMDVAKSTGIAQSATYRMGLTSFDSSVQQLWPRSTTLPPRVDASLDTVKTHVADYTIQPYYVNNWRTSTLSDNDRGTATSTAFTSMAAAMPAPGNGSGLAGDPAQEVMFLITDGMRDELRPSGRPEGPIDTTLCTTIKVRGIRIAVLYTEYLPDSADEDGWSTPNVKTPYLYPTDLISPALTACASPGLFYKVTTDDDIAAALKKLFLSTISSAHVTQ